MHRPLISFLFLIIQVKTCIIMLNRSVRIDSLAWIPIINDKAFNLSPSVMRRVTAFLWMSFIRLKKFLLFLVAKNFYLS